MQNDLKGKTGLRRLRNAFGYSLEGLRAAFRHESAFREELFVAAIAIPVALFLHVGAVAKALMVASVMLVLIVEIINSAIEAAIDHTSMERHPLAKRAKDAGSAAVLLSIVNAVAVWAIVLLV